MFDVRWPLVIKLVLEEDRKVSLNNKQHHENGVSMILVSRILVSRVLVKTTKLSFSMSRATFVQMVFIIVLSLFD